MTDAEVLAALEAQTLAPADLSHAAHVRAGAAALAEAPFLDAVQRYQTAVARYAAGLGVPDKANLTITLGFLSLIAERRAEAPGADGSALLARFPELGSARTVIGRYAPERLHTVLARGAFLMPDHG